MRDFTGLHRLLQQVLLWGDCHWHENQPFSPSTPKVSSLYFKGSSLYQRNPKFCFFLIATHCRGESTQRRTRTHSRGSLLSPYGQSVSPCLFSFSPTFSLFSPKVPVPIKRWFTLWVWWGSCVHPSEPQHTLHRLFTCNTNHYWTQNMVPNKQ